AESAWHPIFGVDDSYAYHLAALRELTKPPRGHVSRFRPRRPRRVSLAQVRKERLEQPSIHKPTLLDRGPDEHDARGRAHLRPRMSVGLRSTARTASESTPSSESACRYA